MSENQKIKTGTTCIGFHLKDAVLVASDMRVTSYKINSDRFEKLFQLNGNMVTTVSGTASDAQKFMRIIKGELKLLELKNERMAYVSEAAMILNSIQYSALRTQGAIVGLILAGYDEKNKFSLYDLGPDGTIIPNEGYVTSGSGSVYVDGVLNTKYKENLSEKEAIELLDECFKASFKNDNASGGGYVVKIIRKNGVEQLSKKLVESKLVEA
jgi:20S proteasome alpha/beta subunit